MLAGRPVAGATVWLGDTGEPREGPEVLASAETDATGHFRIERAEDLAGPGRDLVADALGVQTRLADRVRRVQGEPPGGRRAGPPDARPAGLDPRSASSGPTGSPAAGTRVYVVITNIQGPPAAR